jgi:hypothetical protein
MVFLMLQEIGKKEKRPYLDREKHDILALNRGRK